MTAEHHEDNTGETSQVEPTVEPLEPKQYRKHNQAEGIALEIEGREWTLARLGLARCVSAQRDRIYEDLRLHKEPDRSAVRLIAYYQLRANYELTDEQTVRLIQAANPDELATTTIEGVFVHAIGQEGQTYTGWARSALLANGLNPATIDAEDLPQVLRQLVETGRAMPRSKFTAVDLHLAMHDEILKAL
jgi:hypothetical protein